MSYLPPDAKIGEKLICPVCGKTFKATDDTKYISKGKYLDGCGYTCSWKCFLDRVRNKQQDTEEEIKKKQYIAPTVEIEVSQKADENELFGIIE